MKLRGGDAGPIVGGITAEEEGNIGDSEPIRLTWAEFTRLGRIRDAIVEASGETHPYDLETTAELNIELSKSDLDLIKRATGIQVELTSLTNNELIDNADQAWSAAAERSVSVAQSEGNGGGITQEGIAADCRQLAAMWTEAAELAEELARRGNPSYE